MNALVLVLDPDFGALPEMLADGPVTASDTALAVGALNESDGETTICLVDSAEQCTHDAEMTCRWSGVVRTSGKLAIVNVDGTVLLEAAAKNELDFFVEVDGAMGVLAVSPDELAFLANAVFQADLPSMKFSSLTGADPQETDRIHESCCGACCASTCRLRPDETRESDMVQKSEQSPHGRVPLRTWIRRRRSPGPRSVRPLDAGEGVLADLHDLMREHGWAIRHVLGGSSSAPFSYTVGLTARGWAELVITGLPHEIAQLFLHSAVAEQAESGPFRAGDRTTALTEGGEVVFIGVDDVSGMTAATSLIGEFDALQLVWPDSNDRFPWDAECRNGPEVQPILGSRT